MRSKIVLDADAIIHFAKGGCLSILPDILKLYDFVVLSTVYKEISEPLKTQLDNQVNLLKIVSIVPFDPSGELAKEFALLTKTLGRGESACMVYCRYNHDVIGSSNLKDSRAYCEKYQLTYLTTIDFLYYAVKNRLLKVQEANQFVIDVRNNDSTLPLVDFSTFVSQVEI